MAYLEEFQAQIATRNFHKFWQLWEEYCTSDTVNPAEFRQLLLSIKQSDFAVPFGQYVETALPIWQTITDPEESYGILKLLIDLQTTHSTELAEITLQALKNRYGEDPLFQERLRLVGLRAKDKFQRAISSYDLLAHMKPGNFVFHTGGWGTGEIVEVSSVRQQVTLEFEYVTGRKHLTFENAFKTLVPLNKDHFLVRRFAFADALEHEAKDDPVGIVKLMLRDLGPRNAAEIKDGLCELVIPEKDWSKWWQGARSKLKKDSIVETPSNLRDPFYLRASEISAGERLHKTVGQAADIAEIIKTAYNFVRDLPNTPENQEAKSSLKQKLQNLLQQTDLSQAQLLQIYLLFEGYFGEPEKKSEQLVQQIENIEKAIEETEILALKKRIIVLIFEKRKDWASIFLNLFFSIKQSTLRDFILEKLLAGEAKKQIISQLESMLHHPEKSPECVLWYFQKVAGTHDLEIPFADKEGQCRLFEALLILLHRLENSGEHKELARKIYGMLSAKRYAIVRALLKDSSLDFIHEFLLLVSKCHTFSDHDRKILRALAEVAHPSMSKRKTRTSTQQVDGHIVWATEKGLRKVQEQIQHIGTVEIVENAREIEAARALGDLRENSEYKFALERRSRLQSQLKTLSEQVKRSRVIAKEDIFSDEVGVGNIVDVIDPQGKKLSYTILGPWEANPDEYILSFQSKFAQALMGSKEGDTIQFREEPWKIIKIRSYL